MEIKLITLIYIIPLSLNSIFCKTPTHQIKYSDFKERIKLNPKFFSRWCDYSRVFCPTQKILSSLVFLFLQYIWKETKLYMHLEYLNRNSIWGEITKSLTPIYTTCWYELFSENTIQSERHEKKTGGSWRRQRRGVVKTDGKVRRFLWWILKCCFHLTFGYASLYSFLV